MKGKSQPSPAEPQKEEQLPENPVLSIQEIQENKINPMIGMAGTTPYQFM